MVLRGQKLGFISDAHGNAEALAKGIKILRHNGAEIIFHLGDSIGYIPCVETLRVLDQEHIVCQQGNHEARLFSATIDGSWDRVSRLSQVRTLLDSIAIQTISQWPTERIIKVGNLLLQLVHGSPRDTLNEYIYPNTNLGVVHRYAKADLVVMGHTHKPFIRRDSGRTFVNVGSCGLPRDDARFGAAALYDSAQQAWRIIRFDIEAETSEALARFGAAPEVWKLFLTRRQA